MSESRPGVSIQIGADYDGDPKERALALAACAVAKLIREMDPTEAGRANLASACGRAIADMANDLEWMLS